MNIDVAKQIGAVSREVRAGERDGRPVRTVVATRRYQTDVADLWDAITNAVRIPRWFLPISGDLRLGGRFQLQGNAGGEIRRCESPNHLSVTWEFGGKVTWLDVRLEADSGGARLTLEHVAPLDEHWEQFGPGAVGVGWEMALLGLGQHLGSGAAMDPSEGAAWAGSANGKGFIRESSQAWGQADVASGTDAPTARAAAARTTAAYTGEGEPPVREGG